MNPKFQLPNQNILKKKVNLSKNVYRFALKWKGHHSKSRIFFFARRSCSTRCGFCVMCEWKHSISPIFRCLVVKHEKVSDFSVKKAPYPAASTIFSFCFSDLSTPETPLNVDKPYLFFWYSASYMVKDHFPNLAQNSVLDGKLFSRHRSKKGGRELE